MNNIIASPSFQTWLQGEDLDVRNLLYSGQGRPRLSIFYIAHLTEAQRSFIITLLLENVLAWMRTLGGTSSLRAILYFDEVFGHFPPYPKNPPTKEPLLRLLKQARAFGIGLILATQNPGDLDYKGLSNAGTWFIGKLQTENDKRKVLDGLAAAVSAEHPIDMQQMDQLLSTIQPRVFVMNNIHDPAGPILMHTRWAMSYLRGPLTRIQVSQLMAPLKGQAPGGYAQPGYGQPGGYNQPSAPVMGSPKHQATDNRLMASHPPPLVMRQGMPSPATARLRPAYRGFSGFCRNQACRAEVPGCRTVRPTAQTAGVRAAPAAQPARLRERPSL
ncbi:MAG: ATP-binding protein [Anaerolineae bacterium]|nr:ATP-binding protein [Anaerolineae bacterium]